MDLSIVILTYKSKGLLRQCLKSIRLLNIKLNYEMIVVDNASGDGVGEMLTREFPEVRFIQSPRNGGFAAGNNLGFKQAKGKYIMIVNPDILILTNEIERMATYLENNPEIGLIGPKLLNPDGSTQHSSYYFPTFLIPFYRRTFLGSLPGFKKKVEKYLMADWDHNSNREVDWLLGACLMIRKSAMDRVGYLDERFFMFFEDVDYCRRFWEAGYKVVYFAEAEVVHYHQRPSAGSWWIFGLFNRVTREHIKSWLKYFAKYAGAANPRIK